MATAYRTCTFQGCERKHVSLGYCQGHYWQHRAGRELTPLRGYRPRKREHVSVPCAIRDCSDPSRTKTLCSRHNVQAHSFRIPQEEFAAWWNSTPGCMICGRDEALSVDHDHSCCGNVKRTCGKCNRGLLCRLCNSAIGMLGDDLVLVRRAAGYLAQFSA